MFLNQNKIYDSFLKDTDVGRLQKILARYELFKKVSSIQKSMTSMKIN